MSKWMALAGTGTILGAAIMLVGAYANSQAASRPADSSAVLIGAGDIADCSDLSGAEATAKLLEQNSGTVMAVGDLAYPDGNKENFACYDKTWGRVKSRTRTAKLLGIRKLICFSTLNA